jgi:sugar lactone lactonase YvrE
MKKELAVRRLAIGFTMAAVLLVAFAMAHMMSPRAAAQSAAATGSTAGSAAAAVNGTTPQPIIVATGVPARGLALHSALERAATRAANAQLYFTTATQLNRVFTLDAGAQPATIAGSGKAGFLGDGGAAFAAEFNLKADSLVERSGIAVAPDGTIFIADTNNATIRRIAGPESSEPGVIRSVAGRWAPPQNVELVEPMGIALDHAGNLYIADHGANAIVELPAAAGQPAAAGELEVLAYMVAPASIAAAQDGSKVFAASPETGAVIAIETGTRAMQETIAPRSAASATSTNAAAVIPAGLAVDGGGNLFVANANANQILRFNAAAGSNSKAGAMTTFASGLHSPGDMAFDEKGNLFVTDQGEQQILEFQGAGVAANSVTLSPVTFDFGDEPTGGTTIPAQTFTLTNNSGSTITNVVISFVGGNNTDFVNPSATCLSSLATGSSCTINVSFAPTTSGARSSTLTVTSSFATAATAAVSGTGDDYELALATGQASTATVMNGLTATYNMQGTNDGTFLGTVTLVCPNNAPVETTCILTPPTLDFTSANQTIPFTAAFQTTSRNPKKPKSGTALAMMLPVAGSGSDGGAVRRGGRAGQFPALRGLAYTIALAVFLMLLFMAESWRRIAPAALRLRGLGVRENDMRLNLRHAICVLGLFVVAASLLAGCHHHLATTNGTPAGSTTMVVQGTAQNASRPVTITLVVQ